MSNRLNIRLAFCGFPGPFNPTQIRRFLEQRFDLTIDQERPDYVIHSVFSDEFLHYRNAVRIFFTGENVRPDFNLCDYAFGYDWLEFGDRYMRCPNYALYDQFKDICRRQHTDVATLAHDRRFCNFIYTNRAGHLFRDEFFHLLSSYRRIDSPGAHLHNCDDVIGAAYQGDWSTPKVTYQRGFKFSFAFENSSTPGYTTEKIVHAFAADTIPIYWGNPEIGREFNTRRMVNCHEFPTAEAIVSRIAEIDRSDALYREILVEPFFPAHTDSERLEETILRQFNYIFRQPQTQALRRNLHSWGARYETERSQASAASAFLNSRGLLPFFGRRLFQLWKSQHRAQRTGRHQGIGRHRHDGRA